MIGTLEEIKKLFKIKSNNKDKNILINYVSTDSRTIKKGDLFIALKGNFFNGHLFIDNAIKKGAAAVIGDENIIINIPYLKVKDTLNAYQILALYYRKKQQYKVIAITGSTGKTTTKDMIYSILSKKYKTEKTINNNNNEIGVPLTILSTKPDTEILVLEFGMRNLGEIATLTKIAKPDIGIVTNIGVSHIGLLGSQKNILKAKKELFDKMKKGIILINGEDGFQKKISKDFKGEKHVFGFNNNASIKAINLKITNNSTNLTIVRKKINHIINLSFTEKYLILNSLIAFEIGCIFNISIEKGAKALNNFNNPGGRMNILKLKKITILDGSYNANPDSVKAALLVLSKYKERKIAIIGDMLELGNFEKKYHKEIGFFIKKLNLDFLITVGMASKVIVQNVIKSKIKINNIFSFLSNDEVINCLKNIVKKNDIILIKGSNSMKMKDIVNYLKGVY